MNIKELFKGQIRQTIYMKLELNGRTEEITEYRRNDGSDYKTTGDNEPARREAIIKAYRSIERS